MTAPALQNVADMTTLAAALSRLSLLLTLLLLVPRVGLAAVGPESSSPPGTEQPSLPRLAQDEDAWAREPQRPSRGVRILAETGAGLLTGGGGALLGSLAGLALCGGGFPGSNGGWLPCLDTLPWGFLLGTGLGFSLGTFWGGEVAGGNGRWLGALAGTASGALVGTLAALTLDNPNMGLLVLGFPLALIGSIVGYELTDQGPRVATRAPAVASTHPRVQPLLAVSSRGALLGLGGSF